MFSSVYSHTLTWTQTFDVLTNRCLCVMYVLYCFVYIMCIYVCMYLRVCVCVYIHTYIHTYIYIYAYVCVCVKACMVFIHVCAYVWCRYASTYVCLCLNVCLVYVYTHVKMCVYVWHNICMRACKHAYVCAYLMIYVFVLC